MKLNPSIKNMSNEYIFFTEQTALTFRICLVHFYQIIQRRMNQFKLTYRQFMLCLRTTVGRVK